MFDRFTDLTRKSMAFARKEAQRFGHDFIDTAHILLGLSQVENGVASRVLGEFGFDLQRAREVVGAEPNSCFRRVTMGQLPFTPAAKRTLECCMEAACDLGHPYLGTEHLLLGLLREGNSSRIPGAIEVLNAFGIAADAMRARVLEAIGAGLTEEAAAPRPRARIMVHADRNGESIDLVDENAAIRATIGFSASWQPNIALYDQQGRERVSLRLEADGSPVFELKGKNGEILFRAP